MSAQVKVVIKNSEIDGKPITWNVLAITSYIGGDFQTLELKLSKTEALLANMLLGSDESAPTTEARKASKEEQDSFFKQNRRDDGDKINLDDDD